MNLTAPYVPAPDQGAYKPAGPLPAKQTLEYAKVALELLLLLLAVPWILKQLARNPGDVSRKAAAKHLKGS